MGRHRDALPMLARASANSPSDPEPWCLIAACHLNLGQPEAALQPSERAIMLAPGMSWGHLQRALAVRELNRNADAEVSAGEAVRLAPVGAVELRVLAECQARAGNVTSALQTAQRLQGLAPADSATWTTCGVVALTAGHSRDASRYALEALRLDPTNHAALNNLGVAYRHQYRFIRALQCFVQSWKLSPQDRHAKRNIAAAIMSLTVITALATAQLAIHGAGPAALLLPAAVAIAAWRGLRGLPGPAFRLVGREISRLPHTGSNASRPASRTILFWKIAFIVTTPLWALWSISLGLDAVRRTTITNVPFLEMATALFCAGVAIVVMQSLSKAVLLRFKRG